MDGMEIQKRIKILYVAESFAGGVFTYLRELGNRLIDKYEITIVYAERDTTPHNFERFFDSRIKFVHSAHLQRAVSPSADWKALLELRQIVRNEKPDIVHLNSTKAGIIGRWGLFGMKVPVFYTPHGYSFLMGNEATLKRVVYRLIERVSAHLNCTTIACSKSEYEESLKIGARSIQIDNGIDVQEIMKSVSEHSEQIRANSIFTIGRINNQKDPILFNRIAEQLPKFHFTWIGDGPLRGELTASNIAVTGWLDQESVLKISQQSQVFMLTSQWEGLPMSLLEAMVQKKICIVTDVIGNRDVIENSKNGFLGKTDLDFVNIISKVFDESEENRKIIKKMVNTASREVEDHYSLSRMAEEYVNAYNTQLLK